MLSEWKFSPCASSMLASLLFQIKLFSIILELTFTLCCLASCILIKLFSVILEVFWPSCMLIKILSIILELTFSPCCFAFLCVDCWVFICPFCCIKRRFHKYLYIWGGISWQAFQQLQKKCFCNEEIQEKYNRNPREMTSISKIVEEIFLQQRNPRAWNFLFVEIATPINILFLSNTLACFLFQVCVFLLLIISSLL